MAGAVAGEVSPAVLGDVYCTAIEGCQEIEEMGRVAEWTSALHRWCVAQPGLVTFTGQCSLHRGQVMRARGAWSEALEELGRAVERYREAGAHGAAGLAEYARGDVLRLRGDLDAASSAYELSTELGFDPQPGLALLWMAHGSGDTALAAARRLVAEVTRLVDRCRLLPAAVDLLVAAGALGEARAAADRLAAVAEQVGTDGLRARAAFASGAVDLAAGDAAGALADLRAARRLWGRVGDPYELARVRLLTGRALTDLGDTGSGRRELESARAGFERLGARPAASEVEHLLRPSRNPAGLTGREVEVLRLVATGRSNTHIAAALVLSEKTVARHLSNIFVKLDVGSRTAAAAFAFEHHLL